jgi:hypothetical protein
MSEFLDFTRDDAYQMRQLQWATQRLESADRDLDRAISETNVQIRRERVRTYQWMIDQINAELARRKVAKRRASWLSGRPQNRYNHLNYKR